MSFLRAFLEIGRKPEKQPVIRRREIINLSEYRNNRVYYYSGNNLSVEGLTGGAPTLRFNHPDAVATALAAGMSFPTIQFNRLFISNAISLGDTLTLEFDFYGFNLETGIVDATTALNEVLNDSKKSTLALLDAGTRLHAEAAFVGLATTVLYTVPANRTFYFIGYDHQGENRVAASAWHSQLYFWDPAGAGTSYNISYVGTTLFNVATGLAMHDSGEFTMLTLPAGWSIRGYCPNANSYQSSAIVGVLL